MTDDKNDNKILDKISHILLRKSSLNSPKTKNNNDIIEIAKGVSVVVSSENLRAFLLTKGVSNYYKPLSSDGREDFIKYAQKCAVDFAHRYPNKDNPFLHPGEQLPDSRAISHGFPLQKKEYQ